MKRLSLTAGIALLLNLSATAQTIGNASFEADTFTVFPGYVSGNGAITGWTGGPDASYGLNPAGTSPFANNGTVPDGTNVAFLQRNDAGTFIQTTITDLVDGETYQVSFRANARGGNLPTVDLIVDSATLTSYEITPVGGTAPYDYIAAVFTATDTVASLRLENTTLTGDNTVVIDDVRVKQSTSPWTFTPWLDDSTSGVDPGFTYTHAYNFGSVSDAVINDVLFAGTGGATPSVAGSFTTTNLGSVYNGDANNLPDGGSRVLANDFNYNGFPSTLSLEGLTPGQDYVLTVFSVGWDPVGSRPATFISGDDMLSMDQDVFDNNNGVRFEYSYTADASGTLTLETWPLRANNSVHWYGFANRETVPISGALPEFTLQPANATVLDGTLHTFLTATTGERPMTFQWYFNDSVIPGATESSLEINVGSAAQAGYYRLEATNSQGTVSSDAAFLSVYEQQIGLLFPTGVDGTGALLAGGDPDPHYLLLTNPDGAGLIDSLVQTNVPGAWLANSANSQWVGPRADTVGAAGGDYVYQTTFDLTGNATGVIISGAWASDNAGLAINVNGVPVPDAAISGAFSGLTNFVVDTTLLPPGTVIDGINTLEFSLNNAGAGFTGLRVENLSAALVPLGIAPIIYVDPVGQDVTTGDTVSLSVQVYGTADLLYQWKLDGNDIPGANDSTYDIASTTLADAGDYTVVVTNGEGSATSAIATLNAVDVPPSIVSEPADMIVGTGTTVSLTVVAEGSPVISYQWQKGGVDIPSATSDTLTITGITYDDQDDYTVVVTNPFGTVTTTPATLTVMDSIPGLFNTGVDGAGAPLADGANDNHYLLTVNPDGADLVPAVVEDSSVFPIAAGPWLANSATSKWVGPSFFTNEAAGAADTTGNYHYVTSFDLTGFDPDSVFITGDWASDNAGQDILINGVSTGITNSQFTSYTSFTIDTGFQSGLNTLEFIVNNSALGYTGLRVENLQGLGTMLPMVDLPEISIALNGAGNPVISFVGNPANSYQVERSVTMTTGTWSDISGNLTVPGDNNVSFEDTEPPTDNANYRVRVTLP